MKVIVSHDIDHISVTEHLSKDLIIPKHIVRSHLEWMNGKISFQELMYRFQDLIKNKFNNVSELIAFNADQSVNGTFFIGVENGIGLSYSIVQAQAIVNILKEKNCSIQAHGINYDSQEAIQQERTKFESAFQLSAKGIRMHYVRKDITTLTKIANAGYSFDSTVFDFANPYKVGEMWEFPFQIMDGWIIENGKKWQSVDLEKAKEKTLKLIDEAYEKNINYLGIDFHDRYFSNAFYTWMNWYTWLVEYLKANKVECVNFDTAIKELEA